MKYTDKISLDLMRDQVWKYLGILKNGFSPDTDLLEIRAINKNGSRPQRFEAVEDAVKHVMKVNGKANVYVVFNQANPTVKIPVGEGIKNEDIAFRTWIMIDCDVTKKAKGDSVTNQSPPEAWQATRTMAEKLEQYIKKYNHNINGLITDSGNGHKLFIKIFLPNNSETDSLIAGFYDVISKLFSNDIVDIDVSVKNPARIERVCGTFNLKGEGNPDYEKRVSWIVHDPGTGNYGLLEKSQLAKILEDNKNLVSCQAGTTTTSARVGPARKPGPDDPDAVKAAYDDVQRLCKAGGVTIKQVDKNPSIKYAYKFIIDKCPNAKSHSVEDAYNTIALFIMKDGTRGFACQHGHCKDKVVYGDFRAMCEPSYSGYNERKKELRATGDLYDRILTEADQ